MAERRSPLRGYADRFAAVAVSSAGALRIGEDRFRAQVNLRLDPDGPAAAPVGRELGLALPGPGRSTRAGPVRALGLGPNEWLVLGPPGAEEELVSGLDAAIGAEHGSAVDVSAYRTTVLVSGARSRDLLAHGCALDLHPRAFGAGRCAQTMLAKAQVVLVADADGAFSVLVAASFAGYLADWLLDAAADHIGPAHAHRLGERAPSTASVCTERERGRPTPTGRPSTAAPATPRSRAGD